MVDFLTIYQVHILEQGQSAQFKRNINCSVLDIFSNTFSKIFENFWYFAICQRKIAGPRTVQNAENYLISFFVPFDHWKNLFLLPWAATVAAIAIPSFIFLYFLVLCYCKSNFDSRVSHQKDRTMMMGRIFFRWRRRAQQQKKRDEECIEHLWLIHSDSFHGLHPSIILFFTRDYQYFMRGIFNTCYCSR